MGVKSAPSDFCYMMSEIFKNVATERSIILCYIDDLIILSPKSDASSMIEIVFQKLNENNLCIGLHKCKFFAKSVNFLGYKISCESIEAIKHKIQKLQDAKMPTTLAEAYKLAGIAAFYTLYIPNLQLL